MSIPAYAYSEDTKIGHLFVEFLCVFLLVLNCVSEISGFASHYMKQNALSEKLWAVQILLKP